MLSIHDLNKWAQQGNLKIFNAADQNSIYIFERNKNVLPGDLKELYLLSNGLEGATFKILPLFDTKEPKKTWDSIDRANDKDATKFRLSSEEFTRFLIFGEIEGLNALLYDKTDSSIWFEDDEGLHRTDLNLKDLIDGLLLEEKS